MPLHKAGVSACALSSDRGFCGVAEVDGFLDGGFGRTVQEWAKAVGGQEEWAAGGNHQEEIGFGWKSGVSDSMGSPHSSLRSIQVRFIF